MSKTEEAQEPSMEEILASIRRIIADEDEAGDSAAAGAEADTAAGEKSGDDVAQAIESVDLDESPEPEAQADANETVSEPEAATEMVAEPDVFESADMGAPDDAPMAEAAELEGMAEPEPAPAEEDDDGDVFELTEEVSEEPSESDGAAEAEAAFDAPDIDTDADSETAEIPEPVLETAEEDLTAYDDADNDIVFAREDDVPQAGAEGEPVAAAAGGEDGLLSSDAVQTVSSSFGALENLVLSSQSRTIEDLIQSMLKPMLREWLDTNLPPLVERLVKEEIERVSRGRR